MDGEVQPNGDIVVTLPTPKVPPMPQGQPAAAQTVLPTQAPTAPQPATVPVAPAAPVAVAKPATASLDTGAPDALSLDTKPEPGTVIDEAVAYEYTSTGDSSFDLALGFIGDRGVGPDHPATKAAFAGDFGPMEAVLKNMGARATGYTGFLQAAKDAFARNADKGNATVAAVQAAVGGAEAWATVQKWAAANATPEDKKYINHAFSLGGAYATKAATELAAAYNQHNPKGAAKSALKDGASGGDAPSAGGAGAPLSPADYMKEIGKLTKTMGLRATQSKEYAELTARRKAFRG